MVGNKKAAGVGKPQTASISVFTVHSTLLYYHLKVVIFRLAPWLILFGRLHG